MLRVVPALLSTLPSVRSWLHYEAAAILCGCAWILLNNCWLLEGGGGICLHYIEIETPQELCSDISKQLNQHLCTTASVDCDPANVNGAAAARSLRFPLAAHETHGMNRKQRSEETAFIPLTSWWRNHWGGSYWIYTASTQFLHEYAEPFSTWSLKFNHIRLFYYYHIPQYWKKSFMTRLTIYYILEPFCCDSQNRKPQISFKKKKEEKKTLVSSKEEETGGIPVIILEITSHLLFLIRATKHLH